MADNVIVTPSASYTVAAEDIGASVEVQRVKIVLGTVDVDGGNVGVTNPMPVSGTVSVPAGLSVSAQVSGTVTVAAGLSVSAQVSGTVTVVAGLSVSAVVSGTVTVNGTVTAAAISVVSTVATVLGTVNVNVVAGGAAPGTTAATQSAISAQVVWLAPTQTMTATVNTIAAGFSVQALVTGPVSISAMPAVSISVSAALGTVITILGTQVVSVVPGLSVSAVVSGTVTAVVTGPVSISAMPAISISVSAALGTVITILGTQVVTVVPGLSVSAVVSGTVTAVVTGPVSISAMPAVSISVSAALGTVITILGTQVVTVAGFSFTTATPTVTATGPIVWLANTVTVTVTATVTGSLIISGIVPATTQASVSVSGLPVWMNPTQGVTILGVQLVSLSSMPGVTTALVSGNTGVPVWPGTPPYAPVVVVIPSGAGAVSNAIYAFTIWTGGIVVAAGTTAFPVPAGKVLRIQNVQLAINSSAVTGGSVFVRVIGATATASFASGSIATQPHLMVLQMLVSAGVTAGSILGGQGDLIAGTTFGVVIQASTAFNIVSGVIMGYLF